MTAAGRQAKAPGAARGVHAVRCGAGRDADQCEITVRAATSPGRSGACPRIPVEGQAQGGRGSGFGAGLGGLWSGGRYGRRGASLCPHRDLVHPEGAGIPPRAPGAAQPTHELIPHIVAFVALVALVPVQGTRVGRRDGRQAGEEDREVESLHQPGGGRRQIGAKSGGRRGRRRCGRIRRGQQGALERGEGGLGRLSAEWIAARMRVRAASVGLAAAAGGWACPASSALPDTLPGVAPSRTS